MQDITRSVKSFLAPHVLRSIVLSCALMGSVAWADDVSEVTQLMRAGKSTQAMARVDQALSAKPRDPQLRFLKGVLLAESDKPNDAIAIFTKLTEDFPELPAPYNNLAVLYAAQNQFGKARVALEMAIRTNPSYATAHENLGDVYARLAGQAYAKALQLDSNNTQVPGKLALIRELFSPAVKPVEQASAKKAPSPPTASTSVQIAQNPVASPAATASPGAAPTKPAAAPTANAANAVASVAAPAKPSVNSADTALANTEREVEAAVRAWAAAWSSKDLNKYFSAYGRDFDPANGQSRKTWEKEREARILGKSRIDVRLSDLKIKIEGNKATVRFVQDYLADTLHIKSHKRLDLVKVNDRWVIVRENVGA